MFFLLSPLEQFQIIPVCAFRIGFLDFSFSNSTIIILFGFSFFYLLFSMLLLEDKNLNFLPSK
jgi:hypothetical protein